MKGQNCNRQILQEMRFLLVEVGLTSYRLGWDYKNHPSQYNEFVK
ncbi:MAG: hypothetical protein HW406_2411 [Candidatus Brocadiaceae bacterium]|nr:hypothetical protein [Candidatus Brocadiaceae bacterium]